MECVGPGATTAIMNETVSDLEDRCVDVMTEDVASGGCDGTQAVSCEVFTTNAHVICTVVKSLGQRLGLRDISFFLFFPFLFSQFKCKLAREIKIRHKLNCCN